ncbi:Oligosaccharide biosynthesis protein Alg14-like [Trinorchestia longiramus]|nr:Oligosaccharide biosynthesis protein Alg14-like [Trinorchestia longiramus]
MVVVFTPHFVLGVTMLLVWAVITRIAYILAGIWFGSPTEVPEGSTIKTLVVLGSGGHTGEMLKLINGLDTSRYRPFVFVVAKTDQLSQDRLKQLQEKKSDERNQVPEMGDVATEEGCYELRGSRVRKSSRPDDQLDSPPMPKNQPGYVASIVEVIPRSREYTHVRVTHTSHKYHRHPCTTPPMPLTSLHDTTHATDILARHHPCH